MTSPLVDHRDGVFLGFVDLVAPTGLKLNFFNHLSPRASEPNIILARIIFYCPTIFMQITSLFFKAFINRLVKKSTLQS